MDPVCTWCTSLCSLALACVFVFEFLLGWQNQVKMSLSALFLVGLPPNQHGSFHWPPNPTNLVHNTLKVAWYNGVRTQCQQLHTTAPLATVTHTHTHTRSHLEWSWNEIHFLLSWWNGFSWVFFFFIVLQQKSHSLLFPYKHFLLPLFIIFFQAWRWW